MGVSLPTFRIVGPPNISETNEARNFIFGTDMHGREYQRKKCKIRSKGVMWVSGYPLLEFWDPLISPGRMKLETSYLAQRCMAVSTNEKNSKLGQKGSRGGYVTHFL